VIESCGLLLHRPGPEVLLGHMGGPYWARKDDGAWSMPKGLREDGESPEDAARREFAEEIGPVPPGPLVALGTRRIGSGKTLTAFALRGDFDPARQASTTVEVVWPPRSGRTVVVPEIDRAAWFDLPTAAVKLTRGQVPFLELLVAACAGVVGPSPG
jgi:predicted NUDIX family NTP pyrophosphohydrolase